MFRLASSLFLGWALGANDSANVFGTAVSSKMIKYKTAITLTAIFVILGAFLQGQEGLETLKSLSVQDINSAFFTTLVTAITVTILTYLKLPISTSQAMVGAILGFGFLSGNADFSKLNKIVVAWVLTPIGGFIISIIMYKLFYYLFRLLKPSILFTDSFIRFGLVLSGCYGAFALGANNVANVTGVYTGNLLTPTQAVLIGGISIALGAVTFSKNVMMTVGKSIILLDGFSAFIAVLAHAVTVHIFAVVGVPVSTSQAIVGAVLAIGFIKGIQTINFKKLLIVVLGWISTPFLAFVIALGVYLVVGL